MNSYNIKIIELNSDRKLIYAVKQAGIKTYHPKGRWNGYGYEQLPLVAEITSLAEMRRFNKIKLEIEAKKSNSVSKKPQSVQEKKIAWAKRLIKLVGDEYDITLKDAIDIADAKMDYKEQKINEMWERNIRSYSRRRQQLINKMSRENPLRRIEDKAHAYAIMEAHLRHTDTAYDAYLKEAHELEECGEIDRGSAKEYAYDAISNPDFYEKWF